MKRKVLILTGFLFVALLVGIGFYEKSLLAQQEGAEPIPSIFSEEVVIKPLSPIECARCHYSLYSMMREKGGKHRQVCTNCHKEYHRKKDWEKIKPKCNRCHGYPHGEKAKACQSCHSEPHTPLEIALASVKGKCNLCHAAETEELATHKSAHQEVGCEGCHSKRHGRIPQCFECHDPHVEGQTFEECLTCHSPHSPLNIRPFEGLEIENRVCGSCHAEEFELLSQTPTKHHERLCIECHDKHGFIPKCQKCHGYPHSERLHKKFPQCLKCHIDPHSLRRPKKAEAPKAGGGEGQKQK